MTNTNAELRITPKRLGLFCIDRYCPRCTWYRLMMKFRPPFDLFGGAIFKQMEQAQLAVVAHLLRKNRSLPEEFDPFCDLVEQVPFPRHWSKFQHRHKLGVLLYGEPDDICRFDDDSLAVIDHKTASPKNGDDPLLPMYECQVTGYGYIAEKGLALGEVSKGGLFYWSADHNSAVADPGDAFRGGRLLMEFVPRTHTIDIDYSLLDRPLKEAIRLWRLSTPPNGSEKCADCRKLDVLLAIEAEIQKIIEGQDRLLLRSCINDRWVRNGIVSRRINTSSARSSALASLRNEAMELDFANDGVFLNWEDMHDVYVADPEG